MKISVPRGCGLVAATLVSVAPAIAQDVRINEFMAANATTYPDNYDFDDSSDWIELENTTGSAVDLSDYYLSDDTTQPLRWKFPSGSSISANSFLVVRADGFDAGPGETHIREFSPWDDFTTRNYHTNFKLSADGESVVLTKLDAPTQTTAYIALGANWNYFDQGSLPASDWFASGYDDSSWENGAAELGYGDGDEDTVVDFGPDDNDKYPTTYFRTTFNVTDPTIVTQLNCSAKIDDGAVFYLNGVEVARLRMAPGAVAYEDYSTNDGPEGQFENVNIAAGALVAGVNVLAVEVHQGDGQSSDISIDVELEGVESAGSPVIEDSVNFGFQVDDVSYGRDPNNGGAWTFFGDATPNAANTTFPTADRTRSGDVTFTPPGGFYSGAQNVALSTASAGATIRFTTDGSVPHQSSPAYSTPIAVSSTDVVRARTFEAGKVPGELATHTYFIDAPAHQMAVIGFTVEPDNFFDNELGIYDNVHKGREAPNTLEFYEADQDLAFKVNAGTKIGGENIWRFAQKPLNISMRGKYGDDLISYQIFPDQDLGTFDSIGLRNGGDNWTNSMLRDPMAASILNGQMDNEVGYYRPAVVYLNGSYWGIHNVRLRLGDQYFFNRYGLQPDTYDLVAKKHTISGTNYVAEEGDLVAYNAFQAFVENNDMSDPAIYGEAAAQMELDNFMDYIATVDYVQETSWHHNQEFWRERKEGAQWRWNINDIDRGLNGSNVTSSLIDNMLNQHPIVEGFLDNDGFRDRFVQRYAAHVSSTFHPDRIADIIDALAAETEPEIARHVARWDPEGGFSESRRLSEIAEIKQFAIDRVPHIFSDTANILNFANNTADLAVTVSPPAGGRVLVNGVALLPDYTMTPELYQDIAFDLTAEAAPGFVFTGWSNGQSGTTISETLTGNSSITANFGPSGETLIPPVITGNSVFIVSGSPYTAKGDVYISSGATLAVEVGVTVLMPEGSSIYVEGELDINGTEAEPVTIRPRPGASEWGGIGFTNAEGISTLKHVKIIDATHTAADPVNLKAAVSGLNSDIVIENAEISAPFPVFTRGGSTVVRDCFINPTNTSDGINVKSGDGLVENCTFLGNDAPDTDAVDFDDVADGIIRNNRIYGFSAFNSDGIDVGEGCTNLLLTENKIYGSSDKGVSVGQGSVVHVVKNLIVGCDLAVAVKDTGSTAFIDQNTFAGNRIAVSSFEKNFNKGGGTVHVSNTIFSRSKDFNTEVDALSVLDVSYSLSDTLALPAGTGNFVADPLFNDPGRYDFSINSLSPAVDAGDPAHAPDPDTTRVDIGAGYVFDPDDYPFLVPKVIVINEILSHANGPNGDWIELHNTGGEAVGIGGWFISDSASDLEKYRIADGTMIPAGGYIVFTQTANFGVGSSDPGSKTGFGFSENGETAYLNAPSEGLLLGYEEKEDFGPSASDVSRGRYFKASTNTYNFVAMAAPTPGAANSVPKVGPVVISEIHYHPSSGDAEFIELMNVSGSAVELFDLAKPERWRITDGIEFEFPIPSTLLPGERCLLVRDQASVQAAFSVPAGTQIFQWLSGGLSNSGERVELSSPGDVDGEGVRQFIREDRVVYEDSAPWPPGADSGSLSLTRIAVTEYGNDPSNWVATIPTPGQSGFERWASNISIPSGDDGLGDDPDGDGRTNLHEYATGTNPLIAEEAPQISIVSENGSVVVGFEISGDHPEMRYYIECSPDLSPGSWEQMPSSTLPYAASTLLLRSSHANTGSRMFYRLLVSE